MNRVPTPLGDLCRLITDGKHGDCENQPNSGFFFLSAKDVRDGKLHYDDARQITEDDFLDTHRRTQLEPSDLVISNSGTIGRMAFVKTQPETSRTTFQKSVAILKPRHDKVLPQWLYYFLHFDLERLIGFAGGTAQKNLLLRDLRSFTIALQPILTQRKVAGVLSAYDDLIENNIRRVAILEAMIQATYREWFVEFRFPGHEKATLVDSPLGKIPNGWKPTRLGDLAKEVRRGVDPRELDPETPYFGLEHLPRKSITLGDWGHARDVQSTKLRFRQGEILFGKIRPYFHKVGVAPVDGVCSSDAIVITSKVEEAFGLVLCCVSSEDFVRHATQTSQGTKMPRANWDVLVKYSLPTPQRQLLDEFNCLIKTIIGCLRLLMLKNRNLKRTRDLLLPKLISGQIDVDHLDFDTGDSVVEEPK